MSSPFVELLGALARAFDAIGAGWYLFGAQAAMIHGVARFTADVDVTVRLRDDDPKALVTALSAAGFQMRVEGDGFIQQTRVLPALHIATAIPVDIVLAGAQGWVHISLQGRNRDRDRDRDRDRVRGRGRGRGRSGSRCGGGGG